MASPIADWPRRLQQLWFPLRIVWSDARIERVTGMLDEVHTKLMWILPGDAILSFDEIPLR